MTDGTDDGGGRAPGDSGSDDEPRSSAAPAEGDAPAVADDRPMRDDEAPAGPTDSDPATRAAASADVAALTGPERRLDGRVRVLWAVRGAVGAAVFGTLVAVAGVLVDVGPLPGAAVAVALLVLSVGAAIARYRAWRYEVREDSLFLERGVVTHVRTVAPHVRIQHVDASRGPLERALGLATVVVYTAGSRGADVTIPGLTPARADDLQDRLKRLAIAAEGEDAV